MWIGKQRVKTLFTSVVIAHPYHYMLVDVPTYDSYRHIQSFSADADTPRVKGFEGTNTEFTEFVVFVPPRIDEVLFRCKIHRESACLS